MKKLFTLTLLVALCFASCAKSEPTGGANNEEMGVATISIGATTDVEATRAELTTNLSGKVNVPEAEEFFLVVNGVRNEAGETWNNSWEFANIDEFNGTQYLYRGYYKATVVAGDINDEGYNLPTFMGTSEEFLIVPRTDVDVEITATIANAIVKVEVTDAFKEYFTGGYKLNVETDSNTFEDVTSAENSGKLLFIKPGKFTVSGTATKQANQSGGSATVIPLSKEVTGVARTIYTVKFDVSNAGGATLKITLNDTLVHEEAIEDELNPFA